MSHTERTEMKKEITLGNLLSIGIPILLLLIGWGISVNTRMESSEVRIDRNTNDITVTNNRIDKVEDKIDENFKIVIEKIDRVIENQNK